MILFFLLVLFVVGSVIGSFFNAVIWRIPKNIRLAEKHSRCPRCRHELHAADLIPVFSFLFLQGRCRYCQKPISWRYPAVEMVSALLPLFAVALFGFTPIAFVLMVLLYLLELLFLFDATAHILPDAVSVPGILVAAAFSFLIHRPYGDMLVGGILGAGVFLLQYVMSKGKWIGDGDIRLGALMGVLLGWKLVLLALFIAYVSGAVLGITLIILKRKRWGSALPFGTLLIPATFVALLWGENMVRWYFTLIFQ